jgi:diadenosine tetraphosphate (Ap4A) HIT family hydrolase
MCAEGRPEDNGFGLRIFAGSVCDAYLQRADFQRGYTVAVWRGRHVADPEDLTDEEATVFWLETLRVARALDERFHPAKMNVQMLGNSVPHLHAHLVPRYVTDPFPGWPVPFPNARLPDIPAQDFAPDVEALRATLAAGSMEG